MNAPSATWPAAEAERRWRVAVIAGTYTLGFFGALPWLAWQLGARFDAALLLPKLGAPAAVLGVVEAALGSAWMLLAMLSLLIRGRGLPISHLPPVRLVARGPYRFCRHPIYVGYTAAFSGAGLVSGSAGRGVLMTALLGGIWLLYVVGFEEPRLRERFGEAYQRYRAGAPLLPMPFSASAQRAALRVWLCLRPACERLANRTVLFAAGGALCVTYGALVTVGAVLAAALQAALLGALGVSLRAVAVLQLASCGAMLLGGRVAWLAYEWRALWRAPRATLSRVGFVSFGGYAGLLLCTLCDARLLGVDVLSLLDRTVPVGLLISTFGRLGCLSYGCCYGRPCAHGLRWRASSAKVCRERGQRGSLPRAPTPLLSAASGLVAALAGFAALAHGAVAGAASLTSLLVYFLQRFAVECLRDEPRFTAWRLTRGQLVTLSLAPLMLGSWFGLPSTSATPAGLSWDWAALARHWPVLAALGALVLAVCGYHRKEVGKW